MTSQYNCFVCGHPIDPKGSGTWRRVKCWLKNGNGGHVKKVEEFFDYAHGPCLDQKKEQSESLFG
jgi:hypothetical protein